MQEGNALAYIKTWREKFDRTGWWHSFELPDGQTITGVSTLEAQKMRIAQFPIPEDLRGKRVLDVGTWDGWFAMEMERRGAEVMAIDRFENPRFHEIHHLLGSRVDYRQMSVYDLSPDLIGRFDIVLFMGVLYHLKHPLLGLERVCSVAKDFVAVESFVLAERHLPGLKIETLPVMAFYENDEFGGEFDNWVAPTVPCLLGLCRTAGFVRVELNQIHGYGAAVTGYRNWGPVTKDVPSREAFHLSGVFNAANGGINFDSRSSEEYVCCLVDTHGTELVAGSVWPEVGGYAAQAVFVGLVEDAWQVNCKLPPGLSSGWHEVRLQTPMGFTNTEEIAVDLPLTPGEPVSVIGICDGLDWSNSRVSLKNGFVSLWVRGLPKHADRNNLKVMIGGRPQLTTYIGAPDADGVRQVNVQLAARTPVGLQQLAIRFGSTIAASVEAEITS
ncbi:MAG TPA: methyltransferase domain-containing protein [Bryobacteraceae bacterium]|jgi:tRNA (mo5U34)-methyltransferase|nr:methyltransferase domain-containing protein [Bryobacteraceae bacterium]